MTSKTILYLIIFISLFNFCNAQNSVEINYSDSSTLLFNNVHLTKNINIQDISKSIGEPSKIVDNKKGEISHFYDDLGLVLVVKENVVAAVGINYNWDGDKKYPEKSFTGNLKIGEFLVSKETNQEDISAIKTIEFLCPIKLICASKSRTAKIRCTIAFEENLITQVVFLL